MDTTASDDNLEFLNKSPEHAKQSLGSHLVEFIQTLVIFAAIASAIYLFLAQPHKVSGKSMFPNFDNGDYIITDKITYRVSQPKRGDVIVFKNPRDESQDFIKRILGLPGDTVEIKSGHIYLNGKLLEEPFLDSSVITNPGFFLQESETMVVPEGSYFVVGDNRQNSSDSREWGFLPKNEIIGRVVLRYWPQDAIGIFPAKYEIKE